MASINSRGRYVKTCSKDGSNSIDFRDCSYSSAGIVSPVIVRPLENTTDEYEIISGHRRIMASRKAGITVNCPNLCGQHKKGTLCRRIFE